MTRQVFAERQVAVDLVGRDVVEADVVLAAGVDQDTGADDVGLNEGGRVDQRVVVVALGGVVDDRISVLDQRVDQFLVTDVADDQLDPVLRQAGQVGLVAGVGQLVEHGHVNFGVVLDDIVDEVGADETGPPGDDDVLVFFGHGSSLDFAVNERVVLFEFLERRLLGVLFGSDCLIQINWPVDG